MTSQTPLDPQDLDLVAAFAAGGTSDAEAARAQELIALDTRFSDEHAAQLLAITSLGTPGWFEPMTELEQARIKKAVTPEVASLASPSRSWSQRALVPLSIAAVMVVMVGFAGLNGFGGSDDSAESADTALDASVSGRLSEEIAATDAPASTESPAATESMADEVIPESVSLDDGAGADLEQTSTAAKYVVVNPPETGDLKPFNLGETLDLIEHLTYAQWNAPVPISRYPSLTCWVGESTIDIFGAGIVIYEGVEYEVVTHADGLEARATGTCEAILLP